MRLSRVFPSRKLHSVNSQQFDRIPGMLQPGQDFVNRKNPQLPYHIVTNSLGLRGPETTLKPAKPRILCLGDSFTFGDFVGNDETLPGQLQTQLGDKVEVLNCGVNGTTIIDQKYFLERFLTLDPDIVLLTYYENDLGDLYHNPPAYVALRRNRRLKSGWLGPVFGIVQDTCLFNSALRVRWKLRKWRARQETSEENGYDPLQKIPEYVDHLSEVQRILQERDVQLIFVTFPSHQAVKKEDKRTIAPLLNETADLQIKSVDLTQPLVESKYPVNDLYFIPVDDHPRPLAYLIAAKAISDVIQDEW